MNLYGFAGGDPINYSDPFGLCPNPAGGLAGLKCAIEEIGGAIRSAPQQLAAFAKVFIDQPVAFAAVTGPVGQFRTAGRALQASELLLGEAIAGIGVRTIAGAGVKKGIDDIARLVSTYGGEAADWAKQVGRTIKVEGKNLQVHWYENVKTGLKTEFKHNLPTR